MTSPRISIIVAHSKNRVIGKSNQLLWHISEDLKRFKNLTTGHPIIMGRKTYESIGRALPNRVNFVITHQKNVNIPGCEMCTSLESAIDEAHKIEREEIFIIGGGEVYKQALALVDRLYVTKVDLDIGGDTYFPDYEYLFKKEISREEKLDEKSDLKYFWLILEK